MSKTKLEKGEIFYHADLNKLLLCRDAYFNHVHNEEDNKEHLRNKLKYYTVDNSGQFHTTKYKFYNDWKKFIVVDAKFGGGGTGMGPHDIYPDAWEVYCKPVDVDGVLIKFHQQTNCFAHTINKVKLNI